PDARIRSVVVCYHSIACDTCGGRLSASIGREWFAKLYALQAARRSCSVPLFDQLRHTWTPSHEPSQGTTERMSVAAEIHCFSKGRRRSRQFSPLGRHTPGKDRRCTARDELDYDGQRAGWGVNQRRPSHV